MRKLLVTIFLLSGFIATSQSFPITQGIGSSSTKVQTPGTFSSLTGFVYNFFADTTAANSLSYIRFTPGIVILTASNQLWVRNQALTAWVSIGGSGGSTITSIGTGFKYAVDGTVLVKSGVFTNGLTGDSTSNANSVTAKLGGRLIQNTYISGVNFPLYLDSLGTGTRFRALPNASLTAFRNMEFVNTNGTDSAYIGLGGKTLGSTTRQLFVRTNNTATNSFAELILNGQTFGASGRFQAQGINTNRVNSVFVDTAKVYVQSLGPSNHTSYVYLYPDSVTIYNSLDAGATYTSALKIANGYADQYAIDSLIWRSTNRNTHVSIYKDSLTFYQGQGEYYVYNLERKTDTTGLDLMALQRSDNEWVRVASDLYSKNIYNSNGTLTGSRTVTGGGNALTFTGISDFRASGANITLGSSNATGVTTSSAITADVSSLTSGTGYYSASAVLTSGKMMDIQVSGTAAATNQTGLNIDLAGNNASASQTTYSIKVTNSHGGTTPVNYGVHSTVADGVGIAGFSTTATGVYGQTGSLYGIYGAATASGGIAGFFVSSPTSGTGNGITVQATGIGATTNTAASLTATGATNNYALLVPAASGKIGFGITSPTAEMLHIASANATGTTTTSGLVQTYNSLTTGTGNFATSSSLTSGSILQVTSTSTALIANHEAIDVAMSGAVSTNAITVTGIRSTITTTNATSGTNIAAVFSASGATTANIGLSSTPNVIVGSPTLDANNGLIVQSRSNTGNEGMRVYLNNLTANTMYGPQGIIASSTWVLDNTGGIGINFSTTRNITFLNTRQSFFGGTNTSPTSLIHIAAGTTAASTSPFKLTTGPFNTTAEAGAMEYTTPQLTFTNGTAIRQEVQLVQQSRVSTQYDNTTTTLGNVTGLTANVAASGTYRFEAILYTTSNIGGGIKAAIAGTATATAIIYEGFTIDAGATTQTRATSLASAVGGVTAVTAAYVRITGTITVNGAGTLVVQAAANTAVGTTSVLVGSTFTVNQIL